ncbi:unnamed protein product, partial [Trichobilharzia regenti]
HAENNQSIINNSTVIDRSNRSEVDIPNSVLRKNYTDDDKSDTLLSDTSISSSKECVSSLFSFHQIQYPRDYCESAMSDINSTESTTLDSLVNSSSETIAVDRHVQGNNKVRVANNNYFAEENVLVESETTNQMPDMKVRNVEITHSTSRGGNGTKSS